MDGNLVHVTSLEQAEEMRVIRNSCREFMTVDQYEITPEDQRLWFKYLPADLHPFLYRPRRAPAMGYGIVRAEDARWFVSGGLLPEYRGKGHGKDLFWELADYVHQWAKCDCWLTVFDTNLRAISTYESIGFGYMPRRCALPGQPPNVITMCKKAPCSKTS